MDKGSVLFFDDAPLESENKMFLFLLRESLGALGLRIINEKTIRSVEQRLRKMSFSVVILDIMSEVPRGFKSLESEQEHSVLPALAGIEILKRCRAGYYGDRNKDIPLFMRTARGEPHIRKLCSKAGCSGFFQAGLNDYELIDRIVERLKS